MKGVDEMPRKKVQEPKPEKSRYKVFLTYHGETKPLWLWAVQYGITSSLLRSRLRAGWPLRDALNRL